MSNLTKSALKSVLHYDPLTGDFARVATLTPASKVGDKAGTPDAYGYRQISVYGKNYKAHRLAFLYMTGDWPPEDVDHINGDRMDNRWSNLRLATRQENIRNTKIRSDNTSGVRGVAWSKQRSKWRAYIIINGKQIELGAYDNFEDAVAARQKAEEAEFGEYRRVL